jgi:hypothetical protein
MSYKTTNHNRGRFRLKYRGTECLNCQHTLDISDRYCPNCAQANSIKKVTIKDFLDEFFSNVISYDSRLFRSLSSMILRPGIITREYIAGRRMRYTNPFRFMLSLAIIYFLMLGFSGDFSELDRYGDRNDNFLFNPGEAIKRTIQTPSPAREEALNIMDSVDLSGTIKQYRNRRDSLIVNDPGGYFGNITSTGFFGRIAQKQEFFGTLLGRDSIYSFQEAVDKYGIPNSTENKLSFKLAGSTLKVTRQPGSFMNSLISRLPFATFFFLPVFAIFIVLAYIRKKYTYTDNLIFSFHNQTLLFILLIISFLIDAIFNISTAWLALMVFAFYLYKAMRNFYGQGRFKTIIKYVFLNTIFFILAGIAGLIFILASAFTY